MTQLVIMCAYLLLLVTVGLAAGRMLDRTARDYFLASSTIGPVVLFLSIFGTTMTAFALVGATGEAYHMGISVFPMVASWSALIHAAIFFFIGIPVWSLGKRLGFLTQTAFFEGDSRARCWAWCCFQSWPGY